MINNLRAFQEVLQRNNLPTPDTYLGISELIRSLYRPDVSPNPERIREVLEELTYPITVPFGNPITFKSCSEVLASEALVTFAPKQSGTGDPSPENIRPISGWDSLHLYQDTEQTETPETTHTATFPSTVMGGSYNFVSGEGGEIWKDYLINDLSLTYSSSNQYFQTGEMSELLTPASSSEKIDGNMCEFLANHELTGLKNGQFSITTGGRIRIKIDGYTTESDLKTAFGTYKLTLKVAAPTPITLTPDDVNLLKGANVLWTDGDNVSVKFQTLK